MSHEVENPDSENDGVDIGGNGSSANEEGIAPDDASLDPDDEGTNANDHDSGTGDGSLHRNPSLSTIDLSKGNGSRVKMMQINESILMHGWRFYLAHMAYRHTVFARFYTKSENITCTTGGDKQGNLEHDLRVMPLVTSDKLLEAHDEVQASTQFGLALAL
ncbi:hypothetical protein K461DRAFT_291824 [Myriangium duriaei CBS 260.36]|uniref:Uncharacterized protein n=1 Tax=Myriangium duriaei CBS 260.36 TaxID=1168546 RepID=A0A9P4J7M4_9PEZI|nr:hypothetical protein K461DRAFT_291824 [Myriangium duriaei CBS 260.36]